MEIKPPLEYTSVILLKLIEVHVVELEEKTYSGSNQEKNVKRERFAPRSGRGQGGGSFVLITGDCFYDLF